MWRLVLLFTLVFIFASVEKCLADDGSIYISEVMWNGSIASSADEWLELYNPTDSIMDIAGWKIFDDVKNEMMVEILKGQIPAKGNFLISNNSKDHIFAGGESVLNIDPDLIDSDASLSNDKFQISLRNSADKLIDTSGDGLKPFFYETQNPKASIMRVNDCAVGTNKSCWELATKRENLDIGAEEFATPRNSGTVKIDDFRLESPIILNQPTRLQFLVSISSPPESLTIAQGQKVINVDESYKSISEYSFDECPVFTLSAKSKSGLADTKDLPASCVQFSDDIFISEAMPNPSVGEEWIEIANGGSDKINLSGWSLTDLSGKKYIFGELEIEPFSYFVVYSNIPLLALNNTDEEIFLWNPFGQNIDSIKWRSSVKGYSIAKWGDKTYKTSAPTPAEENKIDDEKITVIIDKDTELDNSLGKKISTEVSDIEVEKGFVTGKILGKIAVIKFDKRIEISSGSRYKIQSVVESENPLIIRLLSINLIEEDKKIVSSAEYEYRYTKTTKTKVTTKRTISKKKIKGIKALERPPNGSNNNEFMVKLLVVITFCYCGVIYAIYSRE